jgi:hypothetical protein
MERILGDQEAVYVGNLLYLPGFYVILQLPHSSALRKVECSMTGHVIVFWEQILFSFMVLGCRRMRLDGFVLREIAPRSGGCEQGTDVMS